jgi:uncharacterized protein YggU (UPF0235/DUF167 family)
MYIKVSVIPKSKREEIIKEKEGYYKIYLKEPAERNLANKRAREVLSVEFNLPISKIRLISGHHTPQKMFSVTDDE